MTTTRKQYSPKLKARVAIREEIRRLYEPFCAPIDERLRAIRELRAAGIDTYAQGKPTRFLQNRGVDKEVAVGRYLSGAGPESSAGQQGDRGAGRDPESYSFEAIVLSRHNTT